MLFIFLIFTLVGFLTYVKWKQTYWRRKNVPCIEPQFLFESIIATLAGKLSIGELTKIRYKKMKLLYKNHLGVGGYRFLNPLFTPIDPVFIKQILTKDFNYFMSHGTYSHPTDILTMNLFNLEGDSWRYLRTKLTPTFTSGKMKMMFETLVEKTEGLENIVNKHAENGDIFAIKDVVARFTTDIIASCAFGIQCNSLEEPDNEFRKYGIKIFKGNRLKLLLVSILPGNLLRAFGFTTNGKEVTRFFIDVVKETIKYREINGVFRKDFMHLLLQLKNQGVTSDSSTIGNADQKKDAHFLSEDDIIAQCFIFFVAGFETSSTTMTFALLLLAQHPEIQEKLREEIKIVLAQNNGKMSYDTVMNMPYLEQVINETLRMYPPVPVLPRVCTRNYKIPNTDVVIEKGTLVPIPIWGLQMDPDYYPNPEEFNPERFEKGNKIPDFTFLPFGEGPRMCIGLRFGLMQTKVGLVSLLNNFRFTLSDKTVTPIKMDPKNFILTVSGQVWVKATKV